MKSSRQSERIRFLSMQIVRLRNADETYQKKRSHSSIEVEAHRRNACTKSSVNSLP